MADRLTYGQEQAEKNLARWQGLSGQMRRPSELASPEEREAYTAQQVRGGQAPAYELSEAYGGMPTGSTRRALRARAAWDAAQTARLQQEEAMRQQAEYDRKLEIEGREELVNQARRESQIQQYRAAQKIAGETETQRVRFVSRFNELDPRTPEFLDQYAALRKENPLAPLVPAVKGLVDDYMNINEIYRAEEKASVAEMEAKQKEERAKEENKIASLAKFTKLAIQTNRNVSQFIQSDIETGELIVDPIAVGEAEAELATKPVADPNASTYRREGAKLREQLRQLDSEIIANKLDARAAKTDRDRDDFNQNTAVLEAQRNLLYSEYVGVQELLKESGAAPTPTSEAEEPAAPKPTEDQIAMARRAIAEQPEGSTLHKLSRQFLEKNGIPLTEQPAQPSTQATTPTQQPEATAPTQTNATTSPTQGSVPQARTELAQQELVAQRAKEEAGLMNQPPVIRDINQAFSSQYSGVREKAGAAEATRRRVDPFKGRDTKDAQTIQLALDLVYPPMEGGGFDVGDSTDPAVVSAAEFLSKVSPSLLRMIATSPASNRSGLSLEEIKQIAAKGKRLPRGSKKTS